jgi:hypothetical protein
VNTVFKEFLIIFLAINILSKIASEGYFESKIGNSYGCICSGTASAAENPSAKIFSSSKE